MNDVATQYLAYANIAAHGVLLIAVVWCIAFPARRIYPMKRKGVAYYAMWGLFLFIFLSHPVLVVLDWNSGLWSNDLRFFLGGPVLALGAALVVWGIATLGTKNTSGLRDGFVARGPYLITRNPQYLADFFIFTGVSIIANSGLVLVTHFLTILVFLLAPIAEEPWLESEYGDEYVAYRSGVPRFL